MTDAECREFITQLIEKVEVYEERQPDDHIKRCARNQIQQKIAKYVSFAW